MSFSVVLIAETTTNFATPLQKHYQTIVVRSGKQGIAAVSETQAQVLILDAISLGTNGERICKQIRNVFPELSIIHIHPSTKKDAKTHADVLLCAPVSARSLLSHLKRVGSQQKTHLLRCGHFQLDTERRILFLRDREVELSPKQSALIEVFMRHPNETLDRAWLMLEVWKTDYTGDTRTLNVHIRFLRELLEKDASQPQYIVTVRGKGYRLDMPKQKKSDH